MISAKVDLDQERLEVRQSDGGGRKPVWGPVSHASSSKKH